MTMMVEFYINSGQLKFNANDGLSETNMTKFSKDYTLLETLGRGAFGSVRKAQYNITSTYRAVKIIKNTG